MAQFEQLQQEFDRLPEKEKFQLGMAGMFRMVEEGTRNTPRNRGYHGLLSHDYHDREEYQTELSDRSVREMSSRMSGEIYRVKIVNALSDIVAPLEDTLHEIQFNDRLQRARQHHENTLYYQGIINSISSLGENNRRHFFSALYLNYQRFMRHPVWNSLLAFGNYVVKPLFKLGWGTLFGFGTKSNTDRIVDAIKEQGEVLSSGGVDEKGMFRRLMSQGVLGFAFNEAIKGTKSIFSSIFGLEKSKTLQEKMVDEQKTTNTKVDLNIDATRDVSGQSKRMESILLDGNRIKSAIHHGIYLLPEKLKRIQESSMEQLVYHTALLGRQQSQDFFHNIESYRTQTFIPGEKTLESERKEREEKVINSIINGVKVSEESLGEAKSFYEESLEKQQSNIDELKSHNRRERMRTFIGGVGRLLAGGGVLSAVVLGGLSMMNDTIREGLETGFSYAARSLWEATKWGISELWKSSTDSLGTDNVIAGLSAVAIGYAFAKGLISAGLATTGGLVVASVWGISTLTGRLAEWVRGRNSSGPMSSEDLKLESTRGNMLAPVLDEIDKVRDKLEIAFDEDDFEEQQRLRKELGELLKEETRIRQLGNKDLRKEVERSSSVPKWQDMDSHVIAMRSHQQEQNSRRFWQAPHSSEGIEAILDHFEGFRAVAYPDEAGVWTIGYGSTRVDGVPVKPGDTITREDALRQKRQDISKFGEAVNSLVEVEIDQAQRDALTSFAYNVGIGAFRDSTLLSKLNRGDYAGAAAEFDRWNKITTEEGKVESRGLTNRRAMERSLFEGSGLDMSSMRGSVSNMRDSVSSGTSKAGAIISAMTGGALDMGGGFLDDIMSSLGFPETQEDSGPDKVIATLDEKSIRELAKQIEKLTDGIGSIQTVDITGVGN